ncbi:MAG: biopolymer transporter ExbD [Bacteroidia bacterium]|nr:biopolymer transporter ExbD [Bacteroidia bacterium]
MPKIKVPRKSTSIDMTAMCDVSFLLLTFFMLTSKFRPPEAVPIDLPNSRSQIKLENIMTISIDKEGKVYFGLNETTTRAELLQRILDKHPEIKLDNNQINTFRGLDQIGFSLAEMPAVLALNPVEFKNYKQNGIPIDSLNNELGEWGFQTRYVDDKLKVALKGDKSTNIKVFNDVINTITEKMDIHKINLITTLSGSSQKKSTEAEPTEITN